VLLLPRLESPDKLSIQFLSKLLAVPHRPWVSVPPGSTMGHIHLYIGDIHQARFLYHQDLGIRTEKLPGALFVAAGSYHPHLLTNCLIIGVHSIPRFFERDPVAHVAYLGDRLVDMATYAIHTAQRSVFW
jgi:hypothetical protein